MVWLSVDARRVPTLRAVALACGCIVALGLSGCGRKDAASGAEKRDAIGSSAVTGAVSAATGASRTADGRLTIDSPSAGERVVVAGGVAVFWVSGRGAGGREVLVSAEGCGRDCEQKVTLQSDGQWKLRLVVPARRGGALIVRAAYADESSRGSRSSVKLKLGSGSSTTPSETSRRSLVMVGDSLAVGMEGPLTAQLRGWDVVVNGGIGRGLAEGLRIINQEDLPDAGSSALAVSLFTNDSPSNISALRAGVNSALQRVGARGCVIWGAIGAPPIGGVSYAAANRELRRLATDHENLRIVAWDRLTAREPSLLEPDDTHPTYNGYARLSKLYAAAARSCG